MPRDIVVDYPLDEKTKRKWDRERWAKNRVSDLPEGFTWKKDGRSGCIYFRRGERVLELFYEISGDPAYDILLWPAQLSSWVLPTSEPIPAGEQRALRAALERWLEEERTRAHFDESEAR
jgi:hypothetical protein